MGEPTTGLFGELTPVALLIPLVVLLPAFAEEVAWRGYAVPRLMGAMSPLRASLVLALPWTIMHLVLQLPGGVNEGAAVWPTVLSLFAYSVVPSDPALPSAVTFAPSVESLTERIPVNGPPVDVGPPAIGDPRRERTSPVLGVVAVLTGVLAIAVVGYAVLAPGGLVAGLGATPSPTAPSTPAPTVKAATPAPFAGTGVITFGREFDADTLAILKPTSKFKLSVKAIAWSATFHEPAGVSSLTFIREPIEIRCRGDTAHGDAAAF